MFLYHYWNIVAPLTKLIQKDVPFKWGPKQQKAFQLLKDNICKELVLVIADPKRQYEIETDVLDYRIGGQLGQRDENNKLHPIYFFLKSFTKLELNYPIYNKELIAIIKAFKEWRHYLSGTNYLVIVRTDYKNLIAFTENKILNKRQIRQIEILLKFNFKISYIKGSKNGRADALSKQEDLKNNEETHPQTMLQLNNDGTLSPTRQVNQIIQLSPNTTQKDKLQEHTRKLNQSYQKLPNIDIS